MIDVDRIHNDRGGAHLAVATFRLPHDDGARLWWGVWSDGRFVFLASWFGWIWEFAADRDGVCIRPLKRPQS